MSGDARVSWFTVAAILFLAWLMTRDAIVVGTPAPTLDPIDDGIE